MKIGNSRRASILRADFSSAEWLQLIISLGPFDVVVSGYSIHHQPHHRKRQLYAEIYSILKAPGLFLNLEHVASPTPAIENLFDSFFIDHLHEFHMHSNLDITRLEIEQSYVNRPDKKENILAPVEEQYDWLRQIGFQEVDCFLKVFELALLGGMKTTSATPSAPAILPPDVIR